MGLVIWGPGNLLGTFKRYKVDQLYDSSASDDFVRNYLISYGGIVTGKHFEKYK